MSVNDLLTCLEDASLEQQIRLGRIIQKAVAAAKYNDAKGPLVLQQILGGNFYDLQEMIDADVPVIGDTE